MKRSLAVAAVVLAACGSNSKAPPPPPPPPVPSIALPSGADLKPFDPTMPGLARPAGMELLNGTAWVVLGNYDANYAYRGPGLLASILPSTGQVALVDLGGAGEKECLNPGFVRAAGGKLYVSCSSDYNGHGAAIVELDPATAQVTRRAATPVGPTGVAVAASKIWFGNGAAGSVYSIDRTTFAVSATPQPLSCPTGGFPYVPDLAVVNGDLLVICSSSTGGVLNRLDQTTGAPRDTVDVGPIAVELAETGDGRIAIVTAGDNTLRLVTVTKTAMTSQVALTFNSKTTTLQDVRAHGQYLFTVASGSNTVQKIDLAAMSGPAVVGEANLGDKASPWNILPLDDNQAIVSNQGSNTIVAVGCPGIGCLQWTQVK